MKKNEVLNVFDERMMKLIAMFYDPLLQQMESEIRERMKEILYLAVDAQLIDWTVYDNCLETVCLMGTGVPMDERDYSYDL